jgi:hypothetical protein
MGYVRLVAGALLVSGLLAGCGGSHRAARLHGSPFLGLACKRATGNGCRRLGLAVWLARPATSVTAVVDGVTVPLRTHAGGSGRYRVRLYWQGFFHDPHAQRLADASARIPIRVRVTAPGGSVESATRHVRVSTGFG